MAVANTITRAEKYATMLDEVVIAASKTELLSTADDLKAEFVGVGTVKVPKIDMPALGAYSKTNGFPAGSVTYDFETFTLAYDRGRQFDIDAMDDEETGGNVVPSVLGQFARTKVVPEVDAVRIARYAAAAGNTVEQAAPTKDNVRASIDTMAETLDELGVMPEDGILFVRPTVRTAIKNAYSREFSTETVLNTNVDVVDGFKIVTMPSSRMWDEITVGDNGFAPAEGASEVWAIYVHKDAVRQIAKHEKMRTFAPDVNQDADATKVQYRLYHDAMVLANKADLIYCIKNVGS